MSVEKVFRRGVFSVTPVIVSFTQHTFTEHSLSARCMLVPENTKVT